MSAETGVKPGAETGTATGMGIGAETAAETGAGAGHAVLTVEDLSVTRPGGRGARRTRVLDGITLSVAPGECLAIVGSSGAGKSVLARTLLGLADPVASGGWRVTAERFELAGADVRGASQRRWRTLRGGAVALVLQDALQSLDPLRTIEVEVGEALALRGVPRRERRARVTAALAAAGLPDPESLLRLRSGELSGGMRQRALIAAAIAGEPKLLVADEPTTALDPATAAQVLREFGRLRDAGTAIVLVSHDLGAVASVADRVAVLDRGAIVEHGSAERILSAPEHPASRALVAAIPAGDARPSWGSRPPAADADGDPAGNPASNPGAAPGVGSTLEPIIELRGVTRGFGERSGHFTGVRGIDLAVRRGEVLGIAGESGAGKTTLVRLIAGADRPDEGTLSRATGARVRLVPQDPLATFDPRWRVGRILTDTLGRAPGNASGGGTEEPAALLRRVDLDPALLGRRPATLSGGERQRVAIARALAARPDVILCDEAVSALDTVTRAGVLDLLRELGREHAVVLVSHDITALAAVSDRVVVMSHGEIVGAAETEAFVRAALGTLGTPSQLDIAMPE